MEHKVTTLETQMALVQQELVLIRNSSAKLPAWLRNSAITMLILIFSQTIAAVWWASELTANQDAMRDDITINSAFRSKYPETQQNIMIKLTEMQTETRHMKDMLKEVKDKLRYVDINTQHKENK